DEGSEHFEPSTLEIVSVDVGNPAWNVIPAAASARMNIRYNDCWTHTTLRAELDRRLTVAAGDQSLGARTPVRWSLAEEPATSNVFFTHDDDLIRAISDAVQLVTGHRPALSTSGGTSDARFIKDYCPVVEFGPVGATMHGVDECVPLADIEQATLIYERFLDAYFPAR
nr:M20/M25/M40 family metallo-hydrolase [Hyphomicrobiales bacterium]